MATADLLFDVSTFRYPEYLGGLSQLAEEATISKFIFSFQSMNNNIKLTRDQLQECWLHALHQEYRKVLSNTARMTQEQIENTEKLLARGIEQVNTLPWFSEAEWDVADYDPSRKMNEGHPRQRSKQQKDRHYKKQQDYDPLLLLQSMPEIRMHAKRFYQDGLEKFLRKTKSRYGPSQMEQYKLHCVCSAQEHVKCLLRANYSMEKKDRVDQVAQGEEKGLEPQSVSKRWDREAKWGPVWTQMRAERKQIASELGNGYPIEQGVTMDIDSSNSNSNSDGTSTRTEPSRLSGLIEMTRNEGRRILRALRAEERREASREVEVTGVQTRSMLRQKQTQRAYQDSVIEIERGLKNHHCDQDDPGSPQQGHETQQSEKETARSTADQLLTSMKLERRESKNATRRKARVKKWVKALEDRSTNPASILSNREPFSNVSTNDSGRYISTRKERANERRVRLNAGNGKQMVNMAGAGTNPSASQELRREVEDRSASVPSNFITQAGEPETGIIKAKTRDEPQSYEGDDMDIEMSGRIARLEM